MDVPCAGAQIVGMRAKLDNQLDELYRVADPVIEVNKCADAHKNVNVHFCLSLVIGLELTLLCPCTRVISCRSATPRLRGILRTLLFRHVSNHIEMVSEIMPAHAR